MVEPTDNRTLLKRTLIAMAAMVGGCVVVVGTITMIAVAIAGKAAPSEGKAATATTAARGPLPAKPASLGGAR